MKLGLSLCICWLVATALASNEPAVAGARAAQIIQFETANGDFLSSWPYVEDSTASDKRLLALSKGDTVKFTGLSAGKRLAIRYASIQVGTISVAVNGAPAHKVNVHSSGALTNSFLHAVIDIEIPTNAVVAICVASNDVPINLDRIFAGDGDLGLSPDIWNLPPLPVAQGLYPADWTGLGQRYNVPDWWRDAKFGAWAHWDPAVDAREGRLVCSQDVSGE